MRSQHQGTKPLPREPLPVQRTSSKVRLVPALCSCSCGHLGFCLAPHPLSDQRAAAQGLCLKGSSITGGAVSTTFCLSPPVKPQQLLPRGEFGGHRSHGVLNTPSSLPKRSGTCVESHTMIQASLRLLPEGKRAIH